MRIKLLTLILLMATSTSFSQSLLFEICEKRGFLFTVYSVKNKNGVLFLKKIYDTSVSEKVENKIRRKNRKLKPDRRLNYGNGEIFTETLFEFTASKDIVDNSGRRILKNRSKSYVLFINCTGGLDSLVSPIDTTSESSNIGDSPISPNDTASVSKNILEGNMAGMSSSNGYLEENNNQLDTVTVNQISKKNIQKPDESNPNFERNLPGVESNLGIQRVFGVDTLAKLLSEFNSDILKELHGVQNKLDTLNLEPDVKSELINHYILAKWLRSIASNQKPEILDCDEIGEIKIESISQFHLDYKAYLALLSFILLLIATTIYSVNKCCCNCKKKEQEEKDEDAEEIGENTNKKATVLVKGTPIEVTFKSVSGIRKKKFGNFQSKEQGFFVLEIGKEYHFIERNSIIEMRSLIDE